MFSVCLRTPWKDFWFLWLMESNSTFGVGQKCQIYSLKINVHKCLPFQVKVVIWPNILQNILLISGPGSHMTNFTFETSYQISNDSRCKWSHSKLEAAINTERLFKWYITVGCWEIEQNLIISRMAPAQGEVVEFKDFKYI